MKLKAIWLLALIFCTSAFAENGLVVHFTVKKTVGNDVRTFTDGVLVRLTESSTLTFPGQYEMHLESRAVSNGDENLVVTLKDLSSGEPVYAGSGATTLKVGKSATVPFHQLAQAKASYEVFLDTSYGQLPQATH